MNVLFVCDNFYPLHTASANCVHAIIRHLNLNGFISDVINLTDDACLPNELNLDEGKIYNVKDVSKIGFGNQNFRSLSLAVMIYVAIYKLKNKINHRPISIKTCKEIQKKLKQIGSRYDVIVPVVSSLNIGYAVMNYCIELQKPYVLYQVDPIATNQVLKKYRRQLYRFEKKLYAKAFAIVTTPILANEKIGDDAYKNSNIVQAEFPNVRDLTNSIRKPDVLSPVICSFCGYIYRGVRDCSYTLKLFSAVKDIQVILKFAGAGQEKLIQKYSAELLKGRLEHVGKLNHKDSIEFMQNSDFLINIGNTMLNQVPSKLFDYISTGLPIINLCKNENCPTIPYLERYGLALNIVETDDETILAEQASLLSEFIQKNKGKRLSYDKIEALFKKNTAEYVGSQFAELLANCR